MATIPGGGHGEFITDTHAGDILHGTAFDDTIFSSFDHVSIFSGAGDDYVQASGAYDHIQGGQGNDVFLTFGGGHDYIDGGAGNDLLMTSDAGGDTLFGGAGDDTLIASGHGNFLDGGAGHDYLQGGNGGDTLVSSTGDDTMVAGGGKEMMIGGTGNNLFVASSGDDTMVGGHGHDTFVFGNDGGKNVVMGFSDGDILQIQKNINGLDVQTAHDVATHVQDLHGSAVITLGTETITLIGVKAEDVHNNPDGYFTVH
jgi:Ca2+-binding RTX toxin-like protein